MVSLARPSLARRVVATLLVVACLVPLLGPALLHAQTDRAPRAVEDCYTASASDALVVAVGAGLLANDYFARDAGGSLREAVEVQTVGEFAGSVTVQPSGAFTYTPDGRSGSFAFTYAASDGSVRSEPVQVTLRVGAGPCPPPPSTRDDCYVTPLETPLDVPGPSGLPSLLANDRGQNRNAEPLRIDLATIDPPRNGSLELSATSELDGSFRYTPNPGTRGTDFFAYQVTDGVRTSAFAVAEIQVGGRQCPTDLVVDEAIVLAHEIPLQAPAIVSVAESLRLADNLATPSVAAVAIDEVVAIRDAPASNDVAKITLDELLRIEEIPVNQAVGAVALEESIRIGDEPTVTVTGGVAAVESVAITDEVTLVSVGGVGRDEVLVVSDEVDIRAVAVLSIDETIAISDVATPAGASMIVVDERLAIRDVAESNRAAVVDLAESLFVSDRVVSTGVASVAVAEVVRIGDEVRATPPSTITVDEVVRVSDAPDLGRGPAMIAVNEAVGVSDAVAIGAPANRPPVLAAIGPRAVRWGSSLTFVASATDPDVPAQSLTFSLRDAPAGATISSRGAFSWTPTASHVGEHRIVVVVADGGSPSLADEETVVVTVEPRATSLVYDGPTRAGIRTTTPLSARLTDTELGTGVAGKTVSFTIGSQTVRAVTDRLGRATASMALSQPWGVYTLTTSFAGDRTYRASRDADRFDIDGVDLSVTARASATTVQDGDVFTVSATVRNGGPDEARGVSLLVGTDERLKLRLHALTDDGRIKCRVEQHDRDLMRCELGDLPVGASIDLEIRARATAPGRGRIEAEVRVTDPPDGDASNDRQLVEITVSPRRPPRGAWTPVRRPTLLAGPADA